MLPDPDFYAQLDALLPERAGTRPSAHDFINYELETILDRFAAEWDTLPPATGLDNARTLVGFGRVVAYYSVVAQLRDGWIWLMSLTVEFYGPVDDDA